MCHVPLEQIALSITVVAAAITAILMVHSCRLGVTADGCNYTEVIAKPCEMMPKRESEREERHAHGTREGRELVLVFGWGVSMSADHIKTRFFRFLGSFYSFFVQIKMILISHASNPRLMGGDQKRREKKKLLLAKAVRLTCQQRTTFAASHRILNEGGFSQGISPEYTLRRPAKYRLRRTP